MIKEKDNTQEIEWESELGCFILTQEKGTKKIKVYNEYENFICELGDFYIVDVKDESALDYYRFIEDLKYAFRPQMNRVKAMIEKAKDHAFVFETTITFNGEKESETQICCFCSMEKYDDLSNDEKFDDDIFFYFHDEEDFLKMFLGQGDFVLNDFEDVNNWFAIFE